MAKLNLDYYGGEDLYSDGDVEDQILDIVRNNEDYSEILAATDNWAIFYHLTPVRENLLEWYDFDPAANLLEIGGGCGALSGLFARKLKEVKVVELSKRRAEILYSRHRSCGNLEVFAGNLNDMSFAEKFSYVTLIGVLEYAGKFTEGPEPFKTFLGKVRSYLKPGGRLLLAIENKFGLKYWAGAREDHTGRIFDGIEGYPNDKSVQTFGRVELEKLLLSAGFSSCVFYYPMPDYKLPKVIYSDEYLPKEDDYFDVSSPNYDSDRVLVFNEKKAFKAVIGNDSFPTFSNSFLVEALL